MSSGVGQSETPHPGGARFSQCYGASVQCGPCRAHVVYKQYVPSLNSRAVLAGDLSPCRDPAGEGVTDVDLPLKGIQSYLNPGVACSPECVGRERQAHDLAEGTGQQVRLIIASFALPGNM